MLPATKAVCTEVIDFSAAFSAAFGAAFSPALLPATYGTSLLSGMYEETGGCTGQASSFADTAFSLTPLPHGSFPSERLSLVSPGSPWTPTPSPPLPFSPPQTRRSVPPSLLAAIRRLNPLDVELIDFARQVFKRRQVRS